MYYNNCGDLMYMLSDYLKDEYGKKLHKLILSSGMTCPNRDGKCGNRGCIFCSIAGSGEFAQNSGLPVEIQIENAKKTIPASDTYIAYFQSFTNTYADVKTIENLYMPVVLRDDIAILSIATRPDCISDEILKVLSKLNKIKPLWIELGLQTIHESTAKYIRRGYELNVYTNAVVKLKAAGINVITHLILGLPGESKEEMLESASFVGKYTDGIKFHCLYVSENTDLAELYLNNQVTLLTKEEYIDILCECIRVIPKEIVVHRITGDADKNSLIAPLWSADKIKLLREINNALYDRNIIQGEKVSFNL